MGADLWGWETESEEHCESLEDVEHPLEWVSQLVICELHLEAGHGGPFCDSCTCELQFHASENLSEGCELCPCSDFYRKPLPVMCAPGWVNGRIYNKMEYSDVEPMHWARHGREKAAREALRELSE